MSHRLTFFTLPTARADALLCRVVFVRVVLFCVWFCVLHVQQASF